MWILRSVAGEIVSFSESPFVPEDGQSQQEVGGTLAAYAGRFAVTADKTRITADGIDTAAVTLRTNTGAGSIDVDVNGITVPVMLVAGIGMLPPITAETAGQIVVRPVDRTQFSAAGEGALVIEAVGA